jgi:hypothetical protein
VALALWAFVMARSVPAIFYVRARLRLERGHPGPTLWLVPVVAHLVALGVVSLLVGQGLLPWLTLLPMLVLTARAAWGLSPYRRPISARTLGWSEVALGVFTVLVAAGGYTC